MLHLRAFVANQVLSRIRTYLGLFCPDFYSDIEHFTQILCRYLPKKLVAKTSVHMIWMPLPVVLKAMILISKLPYTLYHLYANQMIVHEAWP